MLKKDKLVFVFYLFCFILLGLQMLRLYPWRLITRGLLAESFLPLNPGPLLGEDPLKDEDFPQRLCSQSERLLAIRNYCDTHPEFHDVISPDHNQLSKLLVDNEHKMIVCNHPKAASTMWRNWLSQAFNSTYRHKHSANQKNKSVSPLHRYSLKEIANRLNNYWKVVSVRHPMERLYSAYRDKFIVDYKGHKTRGFAVYVINKYRKQQKNLTSYEISFEEFLRGVVDSIAPDNVHWRQYHPRCHPCAIKYDHFVRTETMLRDSQPIFQRLSENGKKPIKYRVIRSRNKEGVKERQQSKKTSNKLEMYRDIPSDLMDDIQAYLKDDMKLFGYNFNRETLEASCGFESPDCC